MIIEFILITDQNPESPFAQRQMACPPQIGSTIEIGEGDDNEYKIVGVKYLDAPGNAVPPACYAEAIIEPIVLSRPKFEPPAKQKALY